MLWCPVGARAACAPSASSSVTATCIGATINQNSPNGYGTGAENNISVTVMPGARVTGAVDGIFFNSGTVMNSGAINGIYSSIEASGTINVTNSGILSGVDYGVFANTANVTNSGTINGNADGVYVNFLARVINSGTITGNNFSGVSGTNYQVTNSGTISGGSYGVAGVSGNVANSGTILGDFAGVVGDGNVINTGTISGGDIGISGGGNLTNSGTISGGNYGLVGFAPNMNNSGIISGGVDGVNGTNANVTNSGTISGGVYGIASIFGSVINSGIISGGVGGINGFGTNVTNSGTISGDKYGIFTIGIASINNSGTISGNIGISNTGINAGGNVTNSGTIVGTGGTALQFTGAPDTLTLQPGSIIIGAINLDGGGDTVNFRIGNQNLTFDTLTGATVTSTVPYVVSGNQIVTVDPTFFAMTNRNLIDFTRSISSFLDERLGAKGRAGAGPTLGFAAPTGGNTRFADALADIPDISAYGSALPALKNPTVRYSDGTTVWGGGFVGQRVQQADGALMHTLNQFYGGMVGGGWQTQAGLRLGAFLGGGTMRSSEDYNMGNSDSDLVFGGLFERYAWSASFLGVALQGGHIRTSTTRNINDNLVPGGTETAKGSYDGWYISSEANYGQHYQLGSLAGASYVLTSSMNLRYLFASFGAYTESGTTAPLTVGAQATSDVEEQGQLNLTRTQIYSPTETLTTDVKAGVLTTQRVGTDTVDATLLGQAIPIAIPGKKYVWGGFAGAGLEVRTGHVDLFASAQYLALSDSSSVVSGEGGIFVAF